MNLQEMSCTCLEFQDRKLPCRHIIAVCKEQTLDPKDYTSQLYSLNTYRNICSKDYTLDPKDYTSQLYSLNTYRNICSKDYTLDPITIKDLKLLLFCCAFFI